METQQMMELLLKEMKAMQEKMDTDREATQEGLMARMDTNTKAIQEVFLAKIDANRKADRDKRKAWREEICSMQPETKDT
jgi:hypothetical protein